MLRLLDYLTIVLCIRMYVFQCIITSVAVHSCVARPTSTAVSARHVAALAVSAQSDRAAFVNI